MLAICNYEQYQLQSIVSVAMSLKVTTTAILLSLFVQYVEGLKIVIVVRESDVINYDKDILATGAIDNGSYVFVLVMF